MIRVLIVDDQNIVRQGIQALLRPKLTLEVVGTAEDGYQALNYIESSKPDVVLMDMEMPGMNGIETIKKISQCFPDVKVLVLSSHEEKEYVAQALKVGAAGYLLKSTLCEDLEQAIKLIHKGYSQIEPKLLKQIATKASVSINTEQKKEKKLLKTFLLFKFIKVSMYVIIFGIIIGLPHDNDGIIKKLFLNSQYWNNNSKLAPSSSHKSQKTAIAEVKKSSKSVQENATINKQKNLPKPAESNNNVNKKDKERRKEKDNSSKINYENSKKKASDYSKGRKRENKQELKLSSNKYSRKLFIDVVPERPYPRKNLNIDWSEYQNNKSNRNYEFEHTLIKSKPNTEYSIKESKESKKSNMILQSNNKNKKTVTFERQLFGKEEQLSESNKVINLKLSDLVILSSKNNREIKNAYLERIAQKYSLETAEDKFNPDFTPSISAGYSNNSTTLEEQGEINTNDSDVSDLRVSANVSTLVPTGGKLELNWIGSNTDNNNELEEADIDKDVFGQGIELSFEQPLLKGAGFSLNKASIEIAQLEEKFNIASLKLTLSDTITSSILAYRDLLQAKKQVEIARVSLEKAKEFQTINKILVESGRLADVEIIQSETEIANRKLGLIRAKNNFESAMLKLVEILDVDKNTRIFPTEPLIVEQKKTDYKELKQIAYKNRPDYLQSKLNVEIAKLRKLVANDEKNVDLSLNAEYRNLKAFDKEDRQDEWIVGLNMTKTFGDRTFEQNFQQAKIDLLRAENNLKDIHDQIDIEVKDRIREINLSFKRVELARQARMSSENQLEIEKRKQNLGKSSIFEVVSFQNDLVTTRNNEIEAIIDYNNALTNLDQVLGTTLENWNIEIEENLK